MNSQPSGSRHRDPLDELNELVGRVSESTRQVTEPKAEAPRLRLLDRFKPLGRQKKLGEVLEEIRGRRGQTSAVEAPAREKIAEGTQQPQELLVRFETSGTLLAVQMKHVAEIGGRPPITPVPRLPPFLPGVANMRGEIVMVIDLPLYIQPRVASTARRSLLIKDDEGRQIAAVLVDNVNGIAPYIHEQVRAPTSPMPNAFRQHNLGVFHFQNQIYSVVDLLSLLGSKEFKSYLKAAP